MDQTSRGGILSILAQMLKTLRDAAENRVELFLVEWQEERLRLLDVLLLVMVGTVCASTALLIATLVVLVIFWDTHRMLVLSLLFLAYAVVAATAFRMSYSRLRRWRAFAATLEQIKKDGACFKERP
jgi:uncharacterized membrane protein YqjE